MPADLELTTGPRIDFGVRAGGHLYPSFLRGRVGFDLPPTGAQKEALPVEPCEPPPVPDPAGRLFESLWNRLPLAGREADDFDRAEDVIECYCESFAALRTACGESVEWLRTIGRVHLRVERRAVHGPDQQEAFEAARLEEALDIDWPDVDAGDRFRISSDVIPPTAAGAFVTLRRMLRRSTRDFTRSFICALDQLVDRGVVGLVTWDRRVDTWCCLHYFRREIEHHDADRTVKTQVQSGQLIAGRRGLWSTETRTTTDTTEHAVRHVRIEHQLVDAQAVTLDDSRLVVPAEVRPLVDRLPAWMAASVGGIIGQGRGEQRIVLDEATETTEDVTVTRVQRMEPAQFFDPAITLGHFVLAGWDESEQDAELERRRQTSARQAAGGEAITGFLCSIVCTLAAVVLLALAVRTPALRPLALPVWLGLWGLAIWQFGRGLQSLDLIRAEVTESRLMRAVVNVSLSHLAVLSFLFQHWWVFVLVIAGLGINVVGLVRRPLVRL